MLKKAPHFPRLVRGTSLDVQDPRLEQLKTSSPDKLDHSPSINIPAIGCSMDLFLFQAMLQPGGAAATPWPVISMVSTCTSPSPRSRRIHFRTANQIALSPPLAKVDNELTRLFARPISDLVSNNQPVVLRASTQCTVKCIGLWLHSTPMVS